VITAHVAGMPVEELLPSLGGVGGSMLLARAWLAFHLRRHREPDE
jgi:hypothetical protein